MEPPQVVGQLARDGAVVAGVAVAHRQVRDERSGVGVLGHLRATGRRHRIDDHHRRVIVEVAHAHHHLPAGAQRRPAAVRRHNGERVRGAARVVERRAHIHVAARRVHAEHGGRRVQRASRQSVRHAPVLAGVGVRRAHAQYRRLRRHILGDRHFVGAAAAVAVDEPRPVVVDVADRHVDAQPARLGRLAAVPHHHRQREALHHLAVQRAQQLQPQSFRPLPAAHPQPERPRPRRSHQLVPRHPVGARVSVIRDRQRPRRPDRRALGQRQRDAVVAERWPVVVDVHDVDRHLDDLEEAHRLDGHLQDDLAGHRACAVALAVDRARRVQHAGPFVDGESRARVGGVEKPEPEQVGRFRPVRLAQPCVAHDVTDDRVRRLLLIEEILDELHVLLRARAAGQRERRQQQWRHRRWRHPADVTNDRRQSLTACMSALVCDASVIVSLRLQQATDCSFLSFHESHVFAPSRLVCGDKTHAQYFFL